MNEDLSENVTNSKTILKMLNKTQSCEYCFGAHFGLTIGMKYFDTN